MELRIALFTVKRYAFLYNWKWIVYKFQLHKWNIIIIAITNGTCFLFFCFCFCACDVCFISVIFNSIFIGWTSFVLCVCGYWMSLNAVELSSFDELRKSWYSIECEPNAQKEGPTKYNDSSSSVYRECQILIASRIIKTHIKFEGNILLVSLTLMTHLPDDKHEH